MAEYPDLSGCRLLVSAVSQELGVRINQTLPVFDKATWTVLVVTVLGVVLAMTPFGKLKGTEEISNAMLIVIADRLQSRSVHHERPYLAGSGNLDHRDPCGCDGDSGKSAENGYFHLRRGVFGEHRRNCNRSGAGGRLQQCAGSGGNRYGAAGMRDPEPGGLLVANLMRLLG